MKKDYTHVCVVLDASGSMSPLEDDTKGSFTSFIHSQKKEGGKTVFDLFQFSNSAERIVRSLDISLIPNDLMDKYNCTGCTALNDAVCTAVDTLGQEFSAMSEDERPEAVVVAIITDGEENASRTFTNLDVKERIKHQTEVYNWQFLFIGAGIDSFAAGSHYGVSRDDCVDIQHSAEGMARMCCELDTRCSARREHNRKLHRDEED